MLLINRKPKRWTAPFWAMGLFVCLILVLFVARSLSLRPAQELCPDGPVVQMVEKGECQEVKSTVAIVGKLFPTLGEMVKSTNHNFLTVERTQDIPEEGWNLFGLKLSAETIEHRLGFLYSPMGMATASTLSRLVPAILVAMFFAFSMAMIATASGQTRMMVTSLGMIWAYVPAIALTPLFFSFPGNQFHIAMVAFGLTPVILRDLLLHIQSLPDAQVIKAQTLHGNTWSILCRVIAPQSLPRLIDATRVSMGLGWILVLAAEFVIAKEGIGLRIWKLKRRYDIDNLLPIVIWVTLLAIVIDLLLLLTKRYGFPWTKGAGK